MIPEGRKRAIISIAQRKRMTKRIVAVLSLFSTVLLLLLGCGGSSSAPRYIFLVTLDTMRADFVNYALQNNDQTPHFARLAAKGMVFENAYTLIPITLPSHASMLYSQPPHHLKVYNNGSYSRVDKPALAQLLRDGGFQTGAVVSLGVLRAEAGLNQGFDQYLEDFRPGLWYRTAVEVNRDAMRQISGFKGKKAFFWIHYSDPHGPYFTPEYDEKFGVFLNEKEIFSGRSTDQFVVNLELDLIPGRNVLEMNTEIPAVNQKKQPIVINNIAFMNFLASGMDDATGVKMDLPSGWNRVQQRRGNVTYFSKEPNSRIVFTNKSSTKQVVKLSFMLQLHLAPESAKGLYREEIVYLDREFGKLIDFLKQEGLYEDSVFVVMGDHGEGLGEIKNNHVGHIHYLNRVYSHVPLFIAGKGVRRPGVRKEIVSNLDIAPTVLELAGLKTAPHMLGTSLLNANVPQRRLLLATYAPEAYFDSYSLMDFPYQLIFTPGRPAGNRMEFLHLEEDAFGGRNLFSDAGAAPRRKAELVNAIKELARVISGGKKKPGTYSKRQEEILKSLGYL